MKSKTKKLFLICIASPIILVFCSYTLWYFYKVINTAQKIRRLEASVDKIYIIYTKIHGLPLLRNEDNSENSGVKLVYCPSLLKFSNNKFLLHEVKAMAPFDKIDRIYEVSTDKSKKLLSLIKINVNWYSMMGGWRCCCLLTPQIIIMSKDKVLARIYIHDIDNNGYMDSEYLGDGLLVLLSSSHQKLKDFFVENKLPMWI